MHKGRKPLVVNPHNESEDNKMNVVAIMAVNRNEEIIARNWDYFTENTQGEKVTSIAAVCFYQSDIWQTIRQNGDPELLLIDGKALINNRPNIPQFELEHISKYSSCAIYIVNDWHEAATLFNERMANL